MSRPTPCYSFDQFRALAYEVENLGSVDNVADSGLEGIGGLIYGLPDRTDMFGYIEDTTTWVKERDGRDDTPQPGFSGRWYLILERSEWRSDDPDELARHLYGWCLDEQVIKAPEGDPVAAAHRRQNAQEAARDARSMLVEARNEIDRLAVDLEALEARLATAEGDDARLQVEAETVWCAALALRDAIRRVK